MMKMNMNNKNETMDKLIHLPPKQGLYDPDQERDACGVGFIAHIKGQPSHQNVLDADTILQAMDHRGACGCEPNTGDGSGIMCGLPHKFLTKVAKSDLGVDLPEPGKFAAGLIFLPQDAGERDLCKAKINQLIIDCGQTLIGWRDVPQESEGADIGPTAKAAEPFIEQLFVGAADGLSLIHI